MAKRRMISVDVFGRGAFMDLPPEAIALYCYLTLYADDDGFHGSPKQAARMLGYGESVLKTLADAGFLILFASGVAALTHWKLTNNIPKDRYTPTVYQKEYAQLVYLPGEGYVLKKDETKMPPPETAAPAREKETSGAPAAELPGLPLSGGGTYIPASEMLDEWKRLYPGADTAQEFRNMRGWLISHPEKQRTAETVGRFINTWLLNAQNRSFSASPGASPQPFSSPYEGRRRWDEGPPSYDVDRAEQKMFTTVPKLKKRQRSPSAVRTANEE